VTPEEGAIIDRLAFGEPVPGAPGACGRPGCAHGKIWHSHTNRAQPCDRPGCGCAGYLSNGKACAECGTVHSAYAGTPHTANCSRYRAELELGRQEALFQ
jgi:hypothetical protein